MNYIITEVFTLRSRNEAIIVSHEPDIGWHVNFVSVAEGFINRDEHKFYDDKAELDDDINHLLEYDYLELNPRR